LTDTPKQFQRILISGADSFKEFPHYEEWILTKDGLVVLGEEIGLSLQTIKVYRDYGRLGPFGLSYDILEHCALVLPCFLPNSEDDVKALIGVAKALDAKRIVWLFDGNEAHDGRIEQWVRSKFSNSIEFIGVQIFVESVGESMFSMRFQSFDVSTFETLYWIDGRDPEENRYQEWDGL
jgi:hypothetical protein